MKQAMFSMERKFFIGKLAIKRAYGRFTTVIEINRRDPDSAAATLS